MSKTIEKRIETVERELASRREQNEDMVDNPFAFDNSDECPKVPKWQAAKMFREILALLD